MKMHVVRFEIDCNGELEAKNIISNQMHSK